MATKEKWEKVFHSAHTYKDDIAIHFGDAQDASISWDNSNSTLDITGATQFTGAMGILGDVTLVGDVTTTGETTKMTVTDPTSATYAFHADINAGGATGWTSGNVCGIRCEVDTTCTGTINDFTGGWFGLTFATGFTALGTGLSCAINAEVVSQVARAANAVLVLQSVPSGASADFSAMPFIYFSETATGTGSGFLFQTNAVTTGASGIFNTTTLRVNINANTRYIPMSTVTNAFTTAAVITTSNTTASTGTDSGAIICGGGVGIAGALYVGDDIVATTSTGADVNVNGIFETLTVSGDCTGSVCGLRVRAVTDGTARTIGNFYGANIDARLVDASDALSGIMAGLQVAVSLGACTTGSLWVYGINIDLSEAGGARATDIKAFINFQDYDYDAAYRCASLFDVGGSASRCSTGTSGDLHYNDTLRILVNTTAKYIPLSSAEGTYTSAYPVALTYGGTALDIASTITTADIIQTITVTDSGTQNTGRGIGLFIDYVASNAKTSAYGIRPLRVNTQVLGDCPTVQVGDWYLHTIADHTIATLFGLTMYWEDVGDNIGDLCMIDLGKNMTHTTSGRDCFIRCREHTGVQADSSILRLEGTNAAAYLVDFGTQAGTGQSILATGSDTTDCTYKIAVRLTAHSATKYIHLFDS